MKSNSLSRVGFVLTLVMGLGAMPAADASDKAPSSPPNPVWQEECASCHVAYPPRFLSAPSWQRVMAGLDDHFKTDASLEPAVAKEITAWLVANARRPKPGRTEPVPPPLRITETRWFRAEHDEISAARFRGPTVGGAANCGACHTTADKGNFSERNIRMPPK